MIEIIINVTLLQCGIDLGIFEYRKVKPREIRIDSENTHTPPQS